MTTPTDTPETDAKIVSIECEDSCCAVFVKLGDIELIEDLVPYSHARDLERARDAALRELTELRKDKDRLDWALGNMTPEFLRQLPDKRNPCFAGLGRQAIDAAKEAQ